MRYTDVPQKPAMLVLSHCVPDPIGTPQRVRAWQFIRQAQATHTVSVACVADAPVNFQQWSALKKNVDQLYIEKSRRVKRWVSHLTRASDEPNHLARIFQSALQPALDNWKHEKQFDAVLCTHPALWPLAQTIRAEMTICDFNRPIRVTTRTQRRNWQAWNRSISHECAMPTIAYEQDLARLGVDSRRAVVLPDTLDLEWYPSPDAAVPPSSQDHAEATPCLALLHVDQTSRTAHRTAAWFSRHVWPRIRQAIPQARFMNTAQNPRLSMLQGLTHASVVAAPVSDAHPSTIPMLQALAMQRAVVASSSVTQELQVQHGRQLLIAHQTQDWADYCIQALRSSQIASHLGRTGRQFIENHSALLPMGQPVHTLGIEDQQSPLASSRAA